MNGGFLEMRTLQGHTTKIGAVMIAVLVVTFTVLSLLVQAHKSHAAVSAYVRVNQVGYITGETKQAILMATGAESGAMFSVVNYNNGQTIYTAPIGASRGSWSSAFPNTYLLDFTSVQKTGSYIIKVNGPIGGSSPVFSINTGANLYAGLLPHSLFFYQA